MSKINDEIKEEDEFFKEDKKNNNPKLIIVFVILIILLSIVAILLLLNLNKSIKNNNDNSKLQDEIILDLEEPIVEEGANEIIDRNEPEATLEPTPVKEEVNEQIEEEIIPQLPDDEPIMETNVKDYSKVKYDIKRNLSEMETYFNDNNLEALDDLAHLDRYIAMSYALKDTTDYAYYGDTNTNGEPDGKGIAVYADNQYYCGEWKNGLRSGAGVWVHYHIHLKENLSDPIIFHEFIGNFENDLPNGHGQDHYEFDPVLMVKNVNYITNYMCNYKDGLIDGEVYATSLDKNGTFIDYSGVASNGSFEYISESRDSKKKGPVLTDNSNGDNYYWLSEKENRNIGVKSYISENKK